MEAPPKLERPRVPKRFYFLTALIFLPVFLCLVIIYAHWSGYVVVTLAFAALLFIRHTTSWHGWRIPLCFLCAFVVAFLGLYCSRASGNLSLMGQIGGGMVRIFSLLPEKRTQKIEAALAQPDDWRVPKGYFFETVTLTNSTLEVLTRDDSMSEFAILQLHGGAFVSDLNNLYRDFALRYLTLSGGAVVYTLDYRLYPNFPYPAQQNDVMDAWVYLTKTLGYPANRIIVVGDSAGGNLVLNLCLRLRDTGAQLPAALIGFSPWGDLSNSGSSHLTNAIYDPTFFVEVDDFDGITPVGVHSTYAKGLNTKSPYLSPSFGDYHGFPKMLLQAGGLEVLLSDSQMVYDNAIKNAVDCTFTVYEGMFHVFQGSLDLLPESKRAWAEVGDFLETIVAPQ